MTAKILVADDSLTIQKVVRITLANLPCELVEVLSEDDLKAKLDESFYDLILLDFNLSENSSGYQLGQMIRSKSPKSSILAMLGTFDSIDEEELSNSGIAEKIVKPFESGKFVEKCNALLAASADVSVDEEESFSAEEESSLDQALKGEESEDLGGWEIDMPEPIVEETSEEKTEEVVETEEATDPSMQLADVGDALSVEIEDWGIEIPGQIGAEGGDEVADSSVLPPVIEEEDRESKLAFVERDTLAIDEDEDNIPDEEYLDRTSSFQLDQLEEEQEMPAEEDLAYPNMEEEDVTDPSMEITEEIREELDQAKEEEQPVDADSFWAADEQSGQEEEMVAIEGIAEDAAPAAEPVAESVEEPVEEVTEEPELMVEEEAETVIEIDQAEIVEQLKASLLPAIEKMVAEHCKETIQQVAWEIIPDLAENVIRKELKEIADSVKK